MPTYLENLKPTLLVGVGGTGCEIADRVYAMAKANQVLTSNRINILGFDTDDNDIRRHPHLSGRQLIRTSTPNTVFELLYSHHGQIDGWFVDDRDLTAEIRQMNLMDGAGQMRMLSRLAFQTALKDARIRADIDNALSGLATHDGQTAFEGQVNVLMVGSLAGGTGSGMFLQAALLLGQKLREMGFSPEIRGLFLLPDIFVQAARLPVQQIPSVLANGYAALLELNAILLQTAGRSPLPVKFEYVPGHDLQPDGMPFVSVVLLDYENTRGGNLGRNLKAYKETAVRAAYTLLFTPIGGRVDSVGVNEVRQRLAAAAQGVSNCFASIGVGAVVYPRERMLDYLALQFGQNILEGDWLKLDQLFAQELAIYQQRVNNGETDLAPPQRAASFVRNLELQAKERVRFFRVLHDNVENPRVEDEAGEKSAPAQYLRYLNELEAQLKSRFWGTNGTLSQIKQREPLAGDTLNHRDALVNDVRLFENERRRYRAAVDEALEDVPFSLFYNLVLGGDTRGESEWTGYHLQSFVLKGNPHLVQVRHFLYRVLEEIQRRAGALNYDRKRKALDAQDKPTIFDNPDTPDYVENAIERAIQIAESNWPVWFHREFKRFSNDYRDYYNGYLQLLRNYAERALLRRVYERLEQHIGAFLEVLERFFSDLSALRDELRQEINQEEAAHQTGTGVTDGNRYVFASRAAKQALWADVRERLTGMSGDGASNAALTQALYARFQEERREDRWKVIKPFSGKDLYRRHIVDGYCRDTLSHAHRDAYGFHVIEAVRREATLAGQPWQAWLTEIVDLVCYQAEPYVSLSLSGAGVEGDRTLFWALAPAVEKAIGDAELLETLFKRNNGSQPLIEDEFPDDSLLCLNTCVNLSLQQLRKLHSGDRQHANIAAPQTGSYAQAYREMVERILADKRAHPEGPARDFTPHLDREWHKPGLLPSLFEDHLEEQQSRLLRAYVLGVALGLLSQEQRHAQPVTVFCDRERQGTPAGERVIQTAHDDLALLDVLRVQPETVAALLDWAGKLREKAVDEQGERAARPEQTVLYRGLRAPATLARILRLSTRRDPALKADEKTSQAIQALFELFKEQVQATLFDLASPEQKALAADEWDGQIRDALALLAQPPAPLREETLATVRRLAEGMRVRLAQEWGV
ncbi:MAG: hypothetical protein H6970_09360 [Gammaproteobacteria bacterium]|nr:hypothetical protein [Gammaproteobacteria bacterium]MCP5425261.1 hypothetical protein [Gammaproteobacteria bacterium]